MSDILGYAVVYQSSHGVRTRRIYPTLSEARDMKKQMTDMLGACSQFGLDIVELVAGEVVG